MIPSATPQSRCTPLARPDNEISRIRELTREQRYDEALLAAEALCAIAPQGREALYLLAVNQRCLNRISAALATLEQLEREPAPLGRLYQERGYCYMSLRDAARALRAFERAVNINPALKDSWSALESLHRMTGNRDKADIAAEQLSALRRLPSEILRAGSLFSDGDLDAAEDLLRAYSLKDAGQVEALRLLARIEQHRGALCEAERLFEDVLTRSPNYGAARLDYARVLLARHKYMQACEQLGLLIQQEPDNLDYRALQATARAGCGDHETAIHAYQTLLSPAPEYAHLHLLLGHSLKAVGRQHEAIASYRAASQATPRFGDAYWSLANLKTYRFCEEDIFNMRAAIAAGGLPPTDQVHLLFALGKALETREEYAESWTHYARGNAMKRAETRYRPECVEINTRRQRDICTREFFAARAGVGAPDPSPIFIVGLPRSGSTLIEQILASHSLVEGTQELHGIPCLVDELQGRSDPLDPRYPGALLDLAPDEFRKLAERYLNDSRAYRRQGRPFFVDKMPNNFRHIGLIHLMLPNAKIIDARREPMACCFGNLTQLFAGGQEFSYDQEFMARYYRTYLDLMRHWDEALPGRVLRVLHEDVVEDLDANVRRILNFCGLEFEPCCVDFHKTVRNVSTASSEQVRQPINRGALGQWRHYHSWLGTLENMLDDAQIRYRENPAES
jgi:tetratricopeptide (TPR) repeat protein